MRWLQVSPTHLFVLVIFFPALNRKRLLFRNQLQHWWHESSFNQSALSRIQLSLRLPFPLYLLVVITYNCPKWFYCLVQTLMDKTFLLTLSGRLSWSLPKPGQASACTKHNASSLLNLTLHLAREYWDSPRKMLEDLCWSGKEGNNATVTWKHVFVYTG